MLQRIRDTLKNVAGRGDPQAAEMQEAVEAATSEFLIQPDWDKNMEICDKLNRDRINLAEALLRALVKRLRDSSTKAQMLALTLLETAVLNCGERFHNSLVNSQAWAEVQRCCQDPQTAPRVQDKALLLVQDWAAGLPHLEAFSQYRDRLVAAGVAFPARTEGAPPPIISPEPQRRPSGRASDWAAAAAMQEAGLTSGALDGLTAEDRAAIEAALAADATAAAPPPPTPPPQQQQQRPERRRAPQPAAQTEQFSARQLEKLKGDLQTARNVQELLSDTVAGIPESDPGQVKAEFVGELVEQSLAIQDRLAMLAQQVQDEDVLSSVLSLHGDLSSVLDRVAQLLEAADAPPPEHAREESYASGRRPEAEEAAAAAASQAPPQPQQQQAAPAPQTIPPPPSKEPPPPPPPEPLGADLIDLLDLPVSSPAGAAAAPQPAAPDSAAAAGTGPGPAAGQGYMSQRLGLASLEQRAPSAAEQFDLLMLTPPDQLYTNSGTGPSAGPRDPSATADMADEFDRLMTQDAAAKTNADQAFDDLAASTAGHSLVLPGATAEEEEKQRLL